MPDSSTRRDFIRTTAAVAAGAALAPALAANTGTPAPQPGAPTKAGAGNPPRAVVLGFDGIDAGLAAEFIAQGHLPNLKKLADKGGFKPLGTIQPPQSPVCWSSILNGTNPGKHGVMGFIRRAKDSYTPELGTIRVERKNVAGGHVGQFAAIPFAALIAAGSVYAGMLATGKGKHAKLAAGAAAFGGGAAAAWAVHQIPDEAPQPVCARQGPSFFELVAKSGRKVASLNTPMDWPVPQRENVIQYAGFEVPDLRGTFGIYSFYTTEYTSAAFVKTEMGADVRRLKFNMVNGEEIAETVLSGARDITRDGMDGGPAWPPMDVPLKIKREILGGAVHVTFGTGFGVAKPVMLEKGKWSDWITLTFKPNAFVRVNGRVRMLAENISPELRLYITPVEFDPAEPAGGNVTSNPPEFAAEIDRMVGGIDTLGWPELTHPVYDENLSDKAFMDHLVALEEKRVDVLRHVLARGDRELVCAFFFGSDRVQHIMWRYIDSDNTAYASLRSDPLAQSVLDIYKFMDRVVGEVLDNHTGPDTLVLALSDHGFAPFRRAVSLNRWLAEQGYLVLKGTQRRRFASDMFDEHRTSLLGEVDWSRTRAYSMDLGKIYLNIKGREPQGNVAEADAPALAREIRGKLEQLKDTERGNAPVVSRVLLREECTHGPFAGEQADLLVGFHRGYRVSWQTTLGFSGEPVIFNNAKRWSGDHCSLDPALIPGVLFSNKRIRGDAPMLYDIAPTVLRAFGMNPGDDMDGHAIDLA